MAFSAFNKVPGVYIDEILVPGPIPGVGTSTVAIIGPALSGPIATPTLVTNPTQFTEEFGGYITAPPVYTTHAVHGFFANGGTSCYFVRVSDAARSSLNLMDDSAGPNVALVVTAKEEGVSGDALQVTIAPAATPLASTQATRVSQTLAGAGATVSQAEVADASGFRTGDIVQLDGGANSERAVVAATDTVAVPNVVTFVDNLTNTYDLGDDLRIADLATGQTKLRVDVGPDIKIESGSYLRFTQNATTEDRVVASFEATNGFVTLDQGLTTVGGFAMDGASTPVSVASLEFDMTVTHPDGTQTASNVAMDPRHSHYFGSNLEFKLDFKHVDVAAPDPPNITPATDNMPVAVLAANLAGGVDQNIPAILASSAGFTSAIDTLELVDDVNMLCVPDSINPTVQQTIQLAMIAHCEKLADRFAILDPLRNSDPSNGIRTQREALPSERGYAAIYYPWLRISNPDPVLADPVLVPPSGHIAGVFARTDQLRGVHKAPANEAFTDVLDLERTLTNEEAGQLNQLSVNVLRKIPNRGFRIWGARTTSPGTQWRYVNVRRLLLFIEESIQEGTQFAVFEPNNLALWETVKRQVSDFLTRVWRDGALFGATPEDAFRVRVDEELNPASVRALGQLHIEVTLFPTTPAEFIVFRIIQQPGGPTIQE